MDQLLWHYVGEIEGRIETQSSPMIEVGSCGTNCSYPLNVRPGFLKLTEFDVHEESLNIRTMTLYLRLYAMSFDGPFDRQNRYNLMTHLFYICISSKIMGRKCLADYPKVQVIAQRGISNDSIPSFLIVMHIQRMRSDRDRICVLADLHLTGTKGVARHNRLVAGLIVCEPHG